MPEITCKSDIIIESIAMKRILEGLLHNVNTPLNLIIGYSQQMKKKYPEVSSAETILSAGLMIDDILQTTIRQLDLRNQDGQMDIILNDWLSDEVKLLKNVLEIKRNIDLDVEIPSVEIHLTIHPLVLSVIIENVILTTVRRKPAEVEQYKITLSLSASPGQELLSIKLPAGVVDLGLEPSNIWKSVEKSFDMDVRDLVPIQIETSGEECLLLKFITTAL